MGMQPGCLALFGTLVALGSEGQLGVLEMEVNGVTNGLFTPLPAAQLKTWAPVCSVCPTCTSQTMLMAESPNSTTGWWEWGLCI